MLEAASAVLVGTTGRLYDAVQSQVAHHDELAHKRGPFQASMHWPPSSANWTAAYCLRKLARGLRKLSPTPHETNAERASSNSDSLSPKRARAGAASPG